MTKDVRQDFVDLMMQWSDKQFDYIHPHCVISHPPVLQYGGTKTGPAGLKASSAVWLRTSILRLRRPRT